MRGVPSRAGSVPGAWGHRRSAATSRDASAQRADVDQGGQNQPNDVDSGDRKVAVDHPGVGQRGERQEQEAEDGDQRAVVSAVQVVGEQEQQHDPQARERQDQEQEEAGHR